MLLHGQANVFDRGGGCVGVAGTVGQEQAIVGHVGEVVVPRHTHHLDATAQQAADDVLLDAAIDKQHTLGCTLVVSDDALAGDLLDEVHTLVLSRRNVLRIVVEDDFAHHHTMFAQHLRQLASVDARDARHHFATQPVGQAFGRVPVAELGAVVADDEG